MRTTKKVSYHVHDPALSFYYGTCLPHRSFWGQMTSGDRTATLGRHASRVWETFCRGCYPGSARYWEKGVEIDLVWPMEGRKKYLVAECKWRRIGEAEERRLLDDLRKRFAHTRLGRNIEKSARIAFKVFSMNSLGRLSKI